MSASLSRSSRHQRRISQAHLMNGFYTKSELDLSVFPAAGRKPVSTGSKAIASQHTPAPAASYQWCLEKRLVERSKIAVRNRTGSRSFQGSRLSYHLDLPWFQRPEPQPPEPGSTAMMADDEDWMLLLRLLLLLRKETFERQKVRV